jgi:hypothetical protein
MLVQNCQRESELELDGTEKEIYFDVTDQASLNLNMLGCVVSCVLFFQLHCEHAHVVGVVHAHECDRAFDKERGTEHSHAARMRTRCASKNADALCTSWQQ